MSSAVNFASFAGKQICDVLIFVLAMKPQNVRN